ncbi:MAG: ASF1 family histone chaperone [Planctomycetota bacterium]|nr:ASF1 family histone chaperone [Planctomycetota bacterium]
MRKGSRVRKTSAGAKERAEAEALREKALTDRLRWIREARPDLWARISILNVLQRLQKERGGHFGKGLVFVHTAMFPFNIRRIGVVDPFRLMVTFEVWPHEAIKQGITWVPLDQIVWAGSTDWELDSETMGFGAKGPAATAPEDARKLAGLA